METCKSCNLIQWWKMLSESHRFPPLWRVISVVDILPHGAPSRSAAVWLTAQGTSANLISGCAGVKWELTLLSAFFKVDWGQQMSFAEVRVINWLESLLRFFLALTQRHRRFKSTPVSKSTGLDEVKIVHSSRDMTVCHCLQLNHYLH